MTRMLIFSPYALWTSHIVYEEVIARACRDRGAELEYLLCDGLLPECDQHWVSKVNAPRPLDICQRCQARATTNLQNNGMPHRWLGQFVNQAERAEAFAWAQGLAPADFREAVFQDAPLGEWVLSSVISYFRQYPPDYTNWQTVSVYRGFLFSAALVATGLKNYLKTNLVDAALLFNGRQSITRVALEIFRQHGIRVLTHERPEYIRGHINVKPNAHCMNFQPFKELWGKWSEIPLTREELDFALQWLIQRRYGANLAWIPFNKSFTGFVFQHTGNRARYKHLWALFTSSTDETAGDPNFQGPYQSQSEWVKDVVQWVGSRDDIELIIKVHPNLGGNFYIGKAGEELRFYQELKSSLPANVRIVFPEDPVNVYALADEADVGLTFGSTIGLEMAMLGKPVLLASRGLYEHGSQIFVVRSKEELPGMLEKCLHATPSRQIQREGFRLAYRFFLSELPFPAVSVLGLFDVKVNDAFRGDLGPGKDKSLDRICNFLIKGEPLYEEPTAAERTRSVSEEDAFFDELLRSPKYLRNSRYELWQRLQSFGRATKGVASRLPLGTGDALVGLARRSWHAFLKRLESSALRQS